MTDWEHATPHHVPHSGALNLIRRDSDKREFHNFRQRMVSKQSPSNLAVSSMTINFSRPVCARNKEIQQTLQAMHTIAMFRFLYVSYSVRPLFGVAAHSATAELSKISLYLAPLTFVD